jgi:hypothetical protein
MMNLGSNLLHLSPIFGKFDKNSLFYGKSIRKEKGKVKENNKAKGKEIKGFSGENRTLWIWSLQL